MSKADSITKRVKPVASEYFPKWTILISPWARIIPNFVSRDYSLILKSNWRFKKVRDLDRRKRYLTSYILVQKIVWRSSKSRVGLASKWQVWSILFLFEIYDHVSKGKFGPLSNCSKRQVWSRFGEKFGPNLPFDTWS